MNIEKIASWLKFLISKYGWKGLKGLYAEKLVLIQLKLNFPKAIIIENVTVPFETYTTQVDFIVLLPTGIYVIEVKNYKGFITATKKYDKWFIKYKDHYNAKSFRINSPLHQNQIHCKAIAQIIDLPERDLINVVSFSNRAQIRTSKGEYLPNVCRGNELIKFLKHNRLVIYSNDDLEAICAKINRNRLVPDLSTDYFHVQLLKQKYNDRIEQNEEEKRKKIQDAQESAHRTIREE